MGENTEKLKAPFPWFGWKSRVADIVGARLGDVDNYVEPFLGSGAVALMRKTVPRTETFNDIDGYIANFWHAIQSDPDSVAYFADWQVTEADLTARHIWCEGGALRTVIRSAIASPCADMRGNITNLRNWGGRSILGSLMVDIRIWAKTAIGRWSASGLARTAYRSASLTTNNWRCIILMLMAQLTSLQIMPTREATTWTWRAVICYF